MARYQLSNKETEEIQTQKIFPAPAFSNVCKFSKFCKEGPNYMLLVDSKIVWIRKNAQLNMDVCSSRIWSTVGVQELHVDNLIFYRIADYCIPSNRYTSTSCVLRRFLKFIYLM